MPLNHEFVVSAVNPFEWHLLVRVQSARLDSALNNLAALRLTTFQNFPLNDKPPVGKELRNGKTVNDFILSKAARIEEGWTEFRFVPPKTQAEKNFTPFRSSPIEEPYTWPGYFTEPHFDIDETNPRVSEDATGAIYLPRGLVTFREIQPPVTTFSRGLLEEFVSAEPFSEADLTNRKPIPDHVEIDYLGWTQVFSGYLHPEFTVPAQSTAGDRTGGGTVDMKAIPAVEYEATNFQRWAPFVLSDEPVFVESEGVWYRRRKRLNPPMKRGRRTEA